MAQSAATEAAPSDRELRDEEYSALVRGMGAVEATDQFLCEEVDLFDSDVLRSSPRCLV